MSQKHPMTFQNFSCCEIFEVFYDNHILIFRYFFIFYFSSQNLNVRGTWYNHVYICVTTLPQPRITYCSALNACARGNEWLLALQVFSEAETKGVVEGWLPMELWKIWWYSPWLFHVAMGNYHVQSR